MKTFSEKNYKNIINKDKLSLVFFTSSGCHLCLKLKPIIKKLEKKYKDIDFYACDINKEQKLSNSFLKDDGVPTGFVLKSGTIFKIKDPESPDDNCWYPKNYLEEIIEALQ